jgi:hypothetical protein
VLAVAMLALVALLATACSSGSSSASVARLSTAATNPGTVTSASAVATQGTGALAFARCMRANGLPNWPDPESNGVFDKSKLQQAGYSATQTRAVEDGPCKNLLPTAAPSPSPVQITAKQRQDYLSAAACMRSHGITNFPDPTFPNGSVKFIPPPGLDTSSAPFTQAQQICEKLVPAGLPYSGSGG